jgi:CarD family transcriptional regulator
MFSIGEKVVYPGLGVAKVDRMVDKKVAQSTVHFYELVFINQEMTILVPVENPGAIGVRRLSSPEGIEEIFAVLQEGARGRAPAGFFASAWNKRSKSYQCKLRSGDLIEIARIYRDLQHVAKSKELSFGERGLLQEAESLLAEEISLVYEIGSEKATEKLRAVFAKRW